MRLEEIQAPDLLPLKARGGEEDDWIVSFADMVTLLLCFFIIYFNEQTPSQMPTVLEEISMIFSSSLEKPFFSGKQQGENGPKEGLGLLPKIESEMRETQLSEETKKIKYGIRRSPRDLTIRMWDEQMFALGSPKLSPVGVKIMRKIAKRLQPYSDRVRIKVKGHSDTARVRRNPKYGSNLELSTLRAMAAADVMLREGFNGQFLKVEGLGSSEPLVKDWDEKEKYDPELGKLNRRIELQVIPINALNKRDEEFAK